MMTPAAAMARAHLRVTAKYADFNLSVTARNTPRRGYRREHDKGQAKSTPAAVGEESISLCQTKAVRR